MHQTDSCKNSREHGQAAVDQLIRELALETAFGLKADEKLLSNYHSVIVKEACKNRVFASE